MFSRSRLLINIVLMCVLIGITKADSLENFHEMIRSGNQDQISILLEEHPEWLNARDSQNLPPVSQAVLAGQMEILSFLIENGADLEAGDNEGSTPLHNACAVGQIDMVKLLLAKGARINARDNNGMTALLFASSRGFVDIAEYLLQNGADRNAETVNGRDVVEMAVLSGQLQMLKYYIDNGFTLNQQDINGNSLLHLALFRLNREMVQFLIQSGIDVNIQNNLGATPLMNSVFRNNPSLTKILLKAGADPNICDLRGVTPVVESVRSGQPAMVRLMLEFKGSVNYTDSITGLNLLQMAAIRGQNETLQLILQKDVIDINAKDKYNMTALDYANKYGHQAVSENLIKAGAKLSKREIESGFCMDLDKKMKPGTARIWYLGHSGWAVKTQNHFLIFDYFETQNKPDETFLRSGYIVPQEIKDQNVFVFSSHNHQDHFISDILQWKSQIRSIQYIFGHKVPQFSDYEYMQSRERIKMDGVDVKTIYSNDTGVGFLVEVDGLVIFHAGDHANRNRDLSGDYTPEIDYISGQTPHVDIAFLPNSGCNFGDNVAVQIGSFYAIDKLNPKVVFPMHDGEYYCTMYLELKDQARQKGISTPIICALNRGDRYYYKNGKIKIE